MKTLALVAALAAALVAVACSDIPGRIMSDLIYEAGKDK